LKSSHGIRLSGINSFTHLSQVAQAAGTLINAIKSHRKNQCRLLLFRGELSKKTLAVPLFVFPGQAALLSFINMKISIFSEKCQGNPDIERIQRRSHNSANAATPNENTSTRSCYRYPNPDAGNQPSFCAIMHNMLDPKKALPQGKKHENHLHNRQPA